MKKQRNSNWKKEMRSEQRQLDSMILPGFLLVLIFCYIPMIGIILAFKNFNPILGIFGSKWVGFDNFRFFFMSDDFSMLMRNTVGYAFWFLFVDNFVAMAFAIMCYNIKNKGVLKYYQTTSILPTFMSIVLVSYIVISSFPRQMVLLITS